MLLKPTKYSLALQGPRLKALNICRWFKILYGFGQLAKSIESSFSVLPEQYLRLLQIGHLPPFLRIGHEFRGLCNFREPRVWSYNMLKQLSESMGNRMILGDSIF